MSDGILGAISGLQAAIRLVTMAIDVRDDFKIKAAVAEMAARVTDANMEALGMSEHLRKLESQLLDATRDLRAAQERIAERENYVLRAVATGVFVYAYKRLEDDPVPAHYICSVCHDEGHKSVLSASPGRYLLCGRDRLHRIQLPR